MLSSIINSRWRFPITFSLINVILATAYSYSFIRPAVEKSYNIDVSLSVLPVTAFFIFLSSFVGINSQLIKIFGLIKTFYIGWFLFSLGFICSGFCTNIWQLALCFGVIAGAGIGIIYSSNLALATKWFPDKKGLATGVTIAGFGLSPLFVVFLLKAILTSVGLSQMFLMTGTVYSLIVLGLILTLSEPKTEAQKNIVLTGFTPKEILKKIDFWYTYFICLCGIGVGLVVLGSLSLILKEILKADENAIALSIGLLAIPNFLGRPVMGYLTTKYSLKELIIVTFSCLILATGLIASPFALGNWAIIIFALGLIMACYGAWMTICPTITSAKFGHKHYPSNFGLMFSSYAVGGLIGLVLNGNIKTIGSFQGIFAYLVGVSIVGLLVTIFTQKNVIPAIVPDELLDLPE